MLEKHFLSGAVWCKLLQATQKPVGSVVVGYGTVNKLYELRLWSRLWGTGKWLQLPARRQGKTRDTIPWTKSIIPLALQVLLLGLVSSCFYKPPEAPRVRASTATQRVGCTVWIRCRLSMPQRYPNDPNDLPASPSLCAPRRVDLWVISDDLRGLLCVSVDNSSSAHGTTGRLNGWKNLKDTNWINWINWIHWLW